MIKPTKDNAPDECHQNLPTTRVVDTACTSLRSNRAAPPFNSFRTLVCRGRHKTIYAVKMRDFNEELYACGSSDIRFQDERQYHKSDIGDPEVAAKVFTSTLYRAFEHERAILRDISCLNNDRIVPLLASHRIWDNYCLLFPLAACNLYEYWAQTDPAIDLGKYSSWFVNETQGLMQALCMLHRVPRNDPDPSSTSYLVTELSPVGIIHGDIKPSNILVYRDNRGTQPKLKWNDFGLSNWVDTDLKFRTTRTYDAPENGMESKLGTKSDVWSFGCVLLDFAVWLLHGHDGVQVFGAQRSMKTPGSGIPLKDDHFYTLVYSDQQPIGATVRAAVLSILEDVVHDERCEGDFEHVVRLVSEGMLVIDENERRDSDQLARALEDLAR
jgi:serine/threonine protein kinase